MSEIKVKTTASHRFGKTINVNGISLSFDKEGIAEVDAKNVSKVLDKKIELVDKTFIIPTDDSEMIASQTAILDKAQAQAKEIIEDAKAQAKEIINEARVAAGLVLAEGQVDEKAQAKADLEEKTVEALKNILDNAKVDKKQYQGKKKEELVQLILELMFRDEIEDDTEKPE